LTGSATISAQPTSGISDRRRLLPRRNARLGAFDPAGRAPENRRIGHLDDAAELDQGMIRSQEGGVIVKKIVVPAMILSLLAVTAAHSQSEDPKAQKRRDAKQIDEQYQRATKGSTWSLSPKPMTDPWQTVKSPPQSENSSPEKK
jgi:hypothetical protein